MTKGDSSGLAWATVQMDLASTEMGKTMDGTSLEDSSRMRLVNHEIFIRYLNGVVSTTLNTWYSLYPCNISHILIKKVDCEWGGRDRMILGDSILEALKKNPVSCIFKVLMTPSIPWLVVLYLQQLIILSPTSGMTCLFYDLDPLIRNPHGYISPTWIMQDNLRCFVFNLIT